jgi:anaerobic magnesium-protoporphyrin IX monomethyl ester cyclase
MDKDTFIAQNLFPKNEDADKIRRPRLNVKSVDLASATRKTKLTLCILGSWAIYMPPYNLARLSALSRESGYFTRVFDFNVESHYELKEENPELSDAWNGANYWWWQEAEYFKRIHPTYEPILKQYLEMILQDETDIIGFSCYYTNILPTIWVINEIKKVRPNVTIVMGGPECAEGNFKKPKNVDYYFVGESEQNILDFLNNWEKGIKPETDKIGSLYSDTRIDIDSLPYPDYSDFDLTKYWGKNSICAEISRGCIAKCTYCTEVYYWKFRDRGAQTIVDELEFQVKKYGITFVSFVDSLMNGNLKEFKKFCQEIVDRKLNIHWWGYARADGRMDLEFYQLMFDSGAQGFNYGFETGSDKVLKAINKKNTVAEINQNIIDSHKVGMKVSACWVIGAPGEDIEAFNHSFNMLWNHRKRIYAVSPGPGLGDNFGSAYDDREKFNINPRNKPWLGGWYSLDLTNTKLHRFIRIKLMHIWLYLCKEFGGQLQNVHSVGQITDHFTVKFDSELLSDEIEYETFNFGIIDTDTGIFANSVMNEVFNLLRMLWRVKGGYEINIKFNKDLDYKDFTFALTPDTMEFDADIWFKIDDEGNYQVKNYYKFKNIYKNVIEIEGFEHTHESSGQWTLGAKIKPAKVFYIKSEDTSNRNRLTLGGCFSSLGIQDRVLLNTIARRLPENSVAVETYSGMGGRASILLDSPSIVELHTFNNFNGDNVKKEFDNIKPWIQGQVIDICKEISYDITIGLAYIKNLETALETDPTGRSFYKHITDKSSKLVLHESNSDVIDKMIDLCFVACFEIPLLDIEIAKWKDRVKTDGYMVVHPYDKENNKELFDRYNELLGAEFKFLNSKESIGIFKKSIE